MHQQSEHKQSHLERYQIDPGYFHLRRLQHQLHHHSGPRLQLRHIRCRQLRLSRQRHLRHRYRSRH